jgi:DNA-binding GntR family transcriptional regulator
VTGPAGLAQLAAPGLAERAYRQLREALVSLRIRPGSPLDEDALMAELGVGRTPVREAVKRLALENLVVVYPRRGTFAAPVEITDLALLSDLRAPLEGLAALRATQRLSPADRTELTALRGRLERRGSGRSARVGGDPAAPAGYDQRLAELDTDRELHAFVHRAARNSYLHEALERYYTLSLRLWYLVIDRLPPLPERVDEHLELLSLLDAGRAEAAQDWACAHVRTFERQVRDVL